MVIGIPHKPLGYDIKHGIAVADDGAELRIQSLLNDLRYDLSVHLMGLVIAYLSELLIGILYDGRPLVRPYRSYGLAHVRDKSGVVYDYAASLLFSEEGKAGEHIRRAPEI